MNLTTGRKVCTVRVCLSGGGGEGEVGEFASIFTLGNYYVFVGAAGGGKARVKSV